MGSILGVVPLYKQRPRCTLERRTSHEFTKFSQVFHYKAFYTLHLLRRQFSSRLSGAQRHAKQQHIMLLCCPLLFQANQIGSRCQKKLLPALPRTSSCFYFLQSALYMGLQWAGGQLDRERRKERSFVLPRCLPLLWIIITKERSL